MDIYFRVASTFAISRRRMVVPIYKRWEANGARIQIIQQEKTVQLVSFFGDFSHGKCMNFALKSTDIFESFSRSGKFSIKIVDAKFALPKSSDDDTSGFVCLDMPDYPGEHDDITLTFDSEKGKVFIFFLEFGTRASTLRFTRNINDADIAPMRIRSEKSRVKTARCGQRGFPHGVSPEITLSLNL